MQLKFPYVSSNNFLAINSFARILALSALLICTFVLTFAIIPFQEWKLHFYQMGIFGAGFVFGPAAGAFVGAASSSYNAIYLMHNPWTIGGNARLGFVAAWLYTRYGALKAALGAFALQAPYLFFTDVYLMHMPVAAVFGILATLLVTNAICAFAAGFLAPLVAKRL